MHTPGWKPPAFEIPLTDSRLVDWLEGRQCYASDDYRADALARIRQLEALCNHLYKLSVDALACAPMPPILLKIDDLKGVDIRHLDGNPNNNEPSNLRLVRHPTEATPCKP